MQSASLELDESAEIISYEEYHPYGTSSYQAKSNTINAVAKRYRYTGKERDEESGLYYHGARYYVPWLCRWCAVEPLESKYGGKSPYQYCDNNPVINIDPDGRDKITFHYLHYEEHAIREKLDSRRDNTSLRSFGQDVLTNSFGSSYKWLTIEKNDQPNTYHIENVLVNSYLDGRQTTVSTSTMQFSNTHNNFDYNEDFYKSVHDFSRVLSGRYGPEISSSSSSQKGRSASNEINALLKREREYSYNKQIDEGVNSLMLGIVEAAAIELVIAEVLAGGTLLLRAGKTAEVSTVLSEVTITEANLLSREEMSLIKGGGIGEGPAGEGLKSFSGTDKAWHMDATPNSIYTYLSSDGKAVSNYIYNAEGKVIYQVDFGKHGKFVSGHGHEMSIPGNLGSGHANHIPWDKVPSEYLKIPEGVQYSRIPGQ